MVGTRGQDSMMMVRPLMQQEASAYAATIWRCCARDVLLCTRRYYVVSAVARHSGDIFGNAGVPGAVTDRRHER